MSANPNYRSIIAHGGFEAAALYAHRSLKVQGKLQLLKLKQQREQNEGFLKFQKLMKSSKEEAMKSKGRSGIDIYRHTASSSKSDNDLKPEELAVEEELQRILQARLDAENQTQAQMLAEERAKRAAEKRRQEIAQFETEFQKFDEDGSGGIDPMELPQILDELIQLGPGGVPHEVINEVILTCDADGDGTLDFEEFCEILFTLKRDYTDPEPVLSDAELIEVLKEEARQKVVEAQKRFQAAAAALKATQLPEWERDPPHPSVLNISYQPHSSTRFTEVAKALAQDVHVETALLANCELGPKSGQALATCMLQNQKLTKINAASNHIGPAGALALFRSITEHETLVHLDLQRNALASDGGLALGRALARNTTLQYLDVSWNSFGPCGAAAVLNALARNETLQVLLLDGNDITPASHAALENALCHNQGLRRFSCSWNEIGPAGGAAVGRALAHNDGMKITTLDLTGNALNDAGAMSISSGLQENRSLVQLLLNDNLIGGVGMTAVAKSLARNRTLEDISMEWNVFDVDAADAMAKALAVNHSLRNVNVSNCALNAEAFGKFGFALREPQTALRRLNMHGNAAGPDGARALASALGAENRQSMATKTPAIQELKLSGNCLGASGAIELAKCVAMCRNLKVLEVGFNKNGLNPIGHVGAVALFNALSGDVKSAKWWRRHFVTGSIAQEKFRAIELDYDDSDDSLNDDVEAPGVGESLPHDEEDAPVSQADFLSLSDASVTYASGGNTDSHTTGMFLHTLDMEGCLFGADAAIEISQHLMKSTFAVQKLNINCCWLRLRGGHAISLALNANISHLVDLNLGMVPARKFVLPSVPMLKCCRVFFEYFCRLQSPWCTEWNLAWGGIGK